MNRDTSRKKVVLVGEPAVGKTSVARRFAMNVFSDRYSATISMDFYAKDLDGIVLDIWDLSGHPEFFDERCNFYKATEILILVFDITSRRTFDCLDMWLNESKASVQEETQVYLCANKIDLVTQRAIPENEAKYWAMVRNIKYFEVSAHDGQGVDVMFDECILKEKDPDLDNFFSQGGSSHKTKALF